MSKPIRTSKGHSRHTENKVEITKEQWQEINKRKKAAARDRFRKDQDSQKWTELAIPADSRVQLNVLKVETFSDAVKLQPDVERQEANVTPVRTMTTQEILNQVTSPNRD